MCTNLILKTEQKANHHEPNKRAQARPQAQLVPAEAEPSPGRLPDPVPDRVAYELLRLVRAEPAGREPEVLHEPRGYVYDARGVPQMPNVRHAIRGGPALPQMQELRPPRFHPRE